MWVTALVLRWARAGFAAPVACRTRTAAIFVGLEITLAVASTAAFVPRSLLTEVALYAGQFFALGELHSGLIDVVRRRLGDVVAR